MDTEMLDKVNQECDIWIPSIRPHLAEDCKKAMAPYQAKYYDGSGGKSYSQIMNECIAQSENEIIFICNDKSRATPKHIEKTIDLLNQGHGFVGLYRFGFFGFKKDLIRKIGFFDERLADGGYEDNDFVTRFKEADISHYLTEEIEYIQMPTAWGHRKSHQHFLNKWEYNPPKYIKRKLPEEEYSYDIGEYQGTEFLPFKDSTFMTYSNASWIPMKIT